MDLRESSLPRLPRLPAHDEHQGGRFGGTLTMLWRGIRGRSRGRTASTRQSTAISAKSLESSSASQFSSQLYLPPIECHHNNHDHGHEDHHKPGQLVNALVDEKKLRYFLENVESLTDEQLSDLSTMYSVVLDSFVDINAAFQHQLADSSTSGINWTLVGLVYELLVKLPENVQAAAQTAVEMCLLNENRSRNVVTMMSVCRDDLRSMLVLLDYPCFGQTVLYSQYSHLLRQFATLCDDDKNLLAKWIMEFTTDQMLRCINHVQTFISTRLFPSRPQDLPPMSKCSWWIPCAVKTLAILHSSNDMTKRVEFIEFYNESLDVWDLRNEYLQWKTPVANCSFTFCHYPFMLSINAKRKLLEAHAEQQMIATARDSIIRNLVSNSSPDPDTLFLNITVRREFILSDSLAQLSKAKDNIRKKLRIHFTGEPGLDMGGLTKEWFQLIIAQIFDPNYGMFYTDENSGCYWFVPAPKEKSKLEKEMLNNYHLVGVVMGLAVYNSVILDVKLPPCCYRKLLSPAVLPQTLDAKRDPLGIVPDFTLLDLKHIMPDTSKNLQQLLDYEGDVQNDISIFFEAGYEYMGENKMVELKPNGSNLPVTNDNRKEYVNRYIDFFLNLSIERQFKAFYFGFHLVCSSEILMLLRPAEIELLVCGNPNFDIQQLRNVAKYENYTRHDKTIRHLWDVVISLSLDLQRAFLRFVTGSDRIPAGGIHSLHFKVTKLTSTDPHNIATNMLPISHTCFNQLCLPDYQDKKKLRKKLVLAITMGSNGFYLA